MRYRIKIVLGLYVIKKKFPTSWQTLDENGEISMWQLCYKNLPQAKKAKRRLIQIDKQNRKRGK